MVSLPIITASEMAAHLAHQVQLKRLSLNFSQKTLSERSGVSLGVIKKFEQTGKISLESLLKIALILGAIEEFNVLFNPIALEQLPSLDELLIDTTRKRGRL